MRTSEEPAAGPGWGRTVGVVLGSVVGTVALAGLSLVAAFLLWTGVAILVGRGDPTWNDGEEVWGTALGLVLVVLLGLAQVAGVRAVRCRTGARMGTLLATLSVGAVLAVHVVVAATFLSGG